MVISGVVWLVRLEGRVNYIERIEQDCQKDVDQLKAEQQMLINDVTKELARVREGLSEIKGIIKGQQWAAKKTKGEE